MLKERMTAQEQLTPVQKQKENKMEQIYITIKQHTKTVSFCKTNCNVCGPLTFLTRTGHLKVQWIDVNKATIITNILGNGTKI